MVKQVEENKKIPTPHLTKVRCKCLEKWSEQIMVICSGNRPKHGHGLSKCLIYKGAFSSFRHWFSLLLLKRENENLEDNYAQDKWNLKEFSEQFPHKPLNIHHLDWKATHLVIWMINDWWLITPAKNLAFLNELGQITGEQQGKNTGIQIGKWCLVSLCFIEASLFVIATVRNGLHWWKCVKCIIDLSQNRLL